LGFFLTATLTFPRVASFRSTCRVAKFGLSSSAAALALLKVDSFRSTGRTGQDNHSEKAGVAALLGPVLGVVNDPTIAMLHFSIGLNKNYSIKADCKVKKLFN